MRLASVFETLFLILSVFVFSPPATAQEGGRAGAFLRAGAGARALGLGGAFVAMANDVTAGYWNPAGLSRLAEAQLIGVYSLLALDRQHHYAAAAYPFGAAGAISVSWVNYHVGDITGRDQTGEATGKFTNSENAFLFSYGKTLLPSLALGGTIKLLRHDLAKRSANGLGYDAGLLLTPQEFLSLGASIQNLHTRISWDNATETQETFPTLTRVGAQINPRSSITLGVDYAVSKRQKGEWHAGAEIVLGGMIGVRAGLDAGAMTLGASVLSLAPNQRLSLDYSLTPDPISGGWRHQFAFLLKFNPPQHSPIAVWTPQPDSLPHRKELQNGRFNLPVAGETAKPDSLQREPVVNETFALPPAIDDSARPLFFTAVVIEVRAPYLIIAADLLEGLQSGMAVKVFRSLFGQETGRYYGLGKALDVSPQYAIIEMQEASMAAALSVGEKLALKVQEIGK